MTLRRPALLCSLVSSVALVLTAAPARAQTSQDAAKLALVTDGPGQWEALRETLQREVTQVLSSQHEVDFLPAFEGDWTPEGAAAKLEAALTTPEVDAVIGLGLYVAQAAAARETLPKPVVLPLAAPELQGLPLSEGTSGRENLTYVAGLLTLERDLRRLADIAPFEHAALLLDARVVRALDRLQAEVERASREVGVEATVVACGTDLEEIVASVPEAAKVAYLGALSRLSPAQRGQLIDALNAQGKLVFGMLGPEDVERGAFASLASPKEALRRSRRVALLLERILRGEPAAEMSVVFEPEEQLSLNRRVAAARGVTPRPEILLEAQLYGEPSGKGAAGELDLRGAVRQAMANNLDVGVDTQAVNARAQGVKRARGEWLPQLDAQAGFDWVDPDVASAFGPAERTLRWGVEGRQVLYSRDRYADLGTSKQRLRESDADLSTTRLDTGATAATSYLNVLRTQVFQQINEENLERTRNNLHLAEARVAVGAAGRDEVYRWQAEVAQRRTDVLVAVATRRRAMLQLNRLLNEPITHDWQLADVEIADVVLVLPEQEALLASEEGERALRAFMVQLALDRSPELRSLDAAIEGQRVTVEAARQRFYAPTVSAVGGFTHLPGTWGAGAGTALAGEVPVPTRDEFTWQVGVQAELPLFAGNARASALREQRRELARAETRRAATAQRIEQRVHDAFLKLTASYPAVALARQAEEAAEKNLEVVTDKYRRGATDIIRLIDAQNQAFLAALARAGAVYGFLVDYIGAERSTGALMFMEDAETRREILRELAQASPAD